ncbi:MAG: hypothetical protein ABSB97_08885, partial [Thermoplasmata archaeon]
MAYRTTMTGSWFRSKEILALLAQSPTGELAESQSAVYLTEERQTIREQLHPLGNPRGLYEVSNGQARVAGYTNYLPNRFRGFSPTERVSMPMAPELVQDMAESSPAMAAMLQTPGAMFSLPKVTS